MARFVTSVIVAVVVMVGWGCSPGEPSGTTNAKQPPAENNVSGGQQGDDQVTDGSGGAKAVAKLTKEELKHILRHLREFNADRGKSCIKDEELSTADLLERLRQLSDDDLQTVFLKLASKGRA